MVTRRRMLALLAAVSSPGCFGGTKRIAAADPRLARAAAIGVLCFRDRGLNPSGAPVWMEPAALDVLRSRGFETKGLAWSPPATHAIEAFRAAGVGLRNALPVEGARAKLAAAVRALATAESVSAVLFVRDIPFSTTEQGTFEIGVVDGATGDILYGASASSIRAPEPPEAILRAALEALPHRAEPVESAPAQ